MALENSNIPQENDLEKSLHGQIERSGKLISFESFQGEVIDLTESDITVIYEVKNNRYEEKLYKISIFPEGMIPKIGDNITAVGLIYTIPKEKN